MQAIMETVFDICYLTIVISLGIIMVKKSGNSKQFKLFGIMAVTLGFGDAFHLVPRAIALCSSGLENFSLLLGAGKFITSITMTIFYVLLYYVWRERYKIESKSGLTTLVYVLAALRIILCLFPQNNWLTDSSPLNWAIYRNIPFTVLGLVIIYIFFKSAKENDDKPFKFMWITIVLSFAFYIPVVLFADIYPMIGMLMIPKTCAYVWTVLIGFFAMKKEIA